MGTHYRHLTEADRIKIDVMRMEKRSLGFIAQAIGFSKSTISREINRAAIDGCDRYFAFSGQRRYRTKRKFAGLLRRRLTADTGSPLWKTVIRGLREDLSPEEIAGRLKLIGHEHQVSHETIYLGIYALPSGKQRSELIQRLRWSRAGRRTRGRVKRRFTGIQNMTSIAQRPAEVASRLVPGHIEGDLIKGAKNASAVGTLVERVSRLVMLAKLDNASSQHVTDAFVGRLRSIPKFMRKSMTYDRGCEMALHQQLTKRLDMPVYFCDPYSPWQRGTNENTNGLIRQYLPKGTDLSLITQQQLTAIEFKLNNRPRKILGFRTPLEVFHELRIQNKRGVALQP